MNSVSGMSDDLAQIVSELETERAKAERLPSEPLRLAFTEREDDDTGDLRLVASLTGTCQAGCIHGFRFETDPQGYERNVPCECRRLRAGCAAVNGANFPARIGHKTRTHEVREVCDDPTLLALTGGFVEAIKAKTWGGAVLYGANGRGKTFRAGLVAFPAAMAGVHTLWVEWPTLLSRLKDAIARSLPLDAITAPLLRAGLLVLDEVKGGGTPFEVETLELLVGKRADRKAPSILTTNHEGAELRALLSDRVWSRLAGADVKQVAVAGDDRRAKAKDGGIFSSSHAHPR